MARIVGLDVGDSRIGVALSDPLGILASPLTIINRTEEQADIEALADIVRRNEVGRIIIGLPLSMDGSMSWQAEKTKAFALALGGRVEVPVEFRDERLTTVSAKRLVREARKTGRGTRYDAAAAAIILQGYLDVAL
ncbi:Holliday junction resolvase RuvX [Chloroflexota bacterium]